MSDVKRYNIPYGNCDLVLETGRLAKQASAAILAQWGQTVVLCACVVGDKREGDFFPLTVDYREKFYASGRIPGGFFKREGRPGTNETLRARLIDRPLRPLFPEGFINEVQVYVTVLSMDQEHPAETAALIASSAALYISEIPFSTPIAGCRVAYINGEYVINPTFKEIEQSSLDLLTAGTRDALCMVECGANVISEEVMVEALRLAHEENKRVIEYLEVMRGECGKPKMEFTPPAKDPELQAEVEKLFRPALPGIHKVYDKKERKTVQQEAVQQVLDALAEKWPEQEAAITSTCDELYTADLRRMMIEDKIRADGRGFEDIRPITCELEILPCTHGSSLFTRGQTQALAALTLGTPDDRQMIDDLMGVTEKAFMLHYNFPSYSVGECRRPAGPGRREIGHGMLAERALLPILPKADEFPYTIRLVSEVLESNGSSSMATVCAGTLALMDGGVPITAPVAGIAMGLVEEKNGIAILSDIMGLEDHLGDMDFKVAGTREGITALQMDIKVQGIDFSVLEKALEQARKGRLHILDKMSEALAEPREDLKPHAPRIQVIHIPIEKIGALIGPGGKIIKEIIEKTGCKIDIEDDGSVFIASNESRAMEMAVDLIKGRTAEAEMGQIYVGKVNRVTNFGAFVEILPGKDGLVHISELDFGRVAQVEDICREGDTLTVKVIGIDPVTGKIRLSRKDALKDKGIAPGPQQERRPSSGQGGGPRRHGDRDSGRREHREPREPREPRGPRESDRQENPSSQVYRWVPPQKEDGAPESGPADDVQSSSEKEE